MITINNAYKSFNGTPVFEDISIKIPAGKIVGLAGPSGSGKSTLLRCIQNLETLDSGEIKFNGTAGFMFQDFQLFPHMTVLENLSYAPRIMFKNSDFHHEAMKILSKLNLADKADYFPNKLSGGQKQRVALARSLMMKPNLLLCDEPTSGLDVATIDDVVQLLKSICQHNMTMIIASHDLDFLSKIADRIVVLRNGTIMADIEPNTNDNMISKLKTFYQ